MLSRSHVGFPRLRLQTTTVTASQTTIRTRSNSVRSSKNASLHKPAQGVQRHKPRYILRKAGGSVTFESALGESIEKLTYESQDTNVAVYLERLSRAFKSADATTNASPRGEPRQIDRPISGSDPIDRCLLVTLRQSFDSAGKEALETQLQYAINNQTFEKFDIEALRNFADFQYPHEHYPSTRALRRQIHLHVGPTNSGKTYQALQKLEQARSGVYAGPLRLLAYEIYSRFKQNGTPCDLVTGDEKIVSEIPNAKSKVLSCTVEMVPLNEVFDVAVIDEIQMLNDDQRGWAWTEALLGLKAKELHLCGEDRVVPLLEELAALMGDELHVHRYQRLSPLITMHKSLHGALSELEKGDCFVVFSRVGLHAKKNEIERVTRRRVAIIHGGLPPEVRAQQARLFNDPSNDYDFLVASDAVGMGLNLAIKRVIFDSLSKFNGSGWEALPAPQVRQIAGRAGRFRVPGQATLANDTKLSSSPEKRAIAEGGGLVTTYEQVDIRYLHQAMESAPDPITSVGILPSPLTLEKFAAQLPRTTPFSTLLLLFQQSAQVSHRYKLCGLKSPILIADIIQSVEGLSLRDRIMFSASPFPITASRRRLLVPILVSFAKCVATHDSGRLLNCAPLDFDILDAPIQADRAYLERLELLHTSIILYLWLGFRFHGVFVDRRLAMHVRELVEYQIHRVLSELKSTGTIRGRTVQSVQSEKRSSPILKDHHRSKT